MFHPLRGIAKVSQTRSAIMSEIARETLFDLIDNGEHSSLVRSLNAQNLAAEYSRDARRQLRALLTREPITE